MVAKKTIGQTCPKCKGITPSHGKFCMHCGKNMHPQSTKLWPGKVLRIKEGIDPKVVVDAILTSVVPKYIDFDPKKVTEKDLRIGLALLTQKRQQLVIRLSGADGKQPRSIKEVADESGSQPFSVKQTAKNAFFRLALELRVIRPSSAFRKRQEESSRGLQAIFDQALQK